MRAEGPEERERSGLRLNIRRRNEDERGGKHREHGGRDGRDYSRGIKDVKEMQSWLREFANHSCILDSVCVCVCPAHSA